MKWSKYIIAIIFITETDPNGLAFDPVLVRMCLKMTELRKLLPTEWSPCFMLTQGGGESLILYLDTSPLGSMGHAKPVIPDTNSHCGSGIEEVSSFHRMPDSSHSWFIASRITLKNTLLYYVYHNEFYVIK